jgi:hypothetical protein
LGSRLFLFQHTDHFVILAQTYLAYFKMKFAMVSLDPSTFPSHPIHTRYCLASANIAVLRFIADTKNLVKDGVEADIATALTAADEGAAENAEYRRSHLRTWLKSSEPLGYGEDAFVPLIRAVIPPGGVIRLPTDNTTPMSTLELAALLYDMGKPDSPSQVQAPVVAKGSFLTVLRVAIKFISARCQAPHDRATFVQKILATVLDFHKVHHVPWSPPPPAGAQRGRRYRAPVFSQWRSTGKVLESGRSAMMEVLEHDELEDIMITQTAQRSQMQNASAEWTMGEQSIGHIYKLLGKQSLPSDWKLHHATLPPDSDRAGEYVRQTYKWVQRKYNMRNEIHHLGLIVGFMMSKVTPYLGHNAQAFTPLVGASRNEINITASVRASPWNFVDPSSHKGLTDRAPFLVMFHVYLVALMEPQSPLRIYMGANKDKLGDAWTKKHGQ